jgi:predicted polyphosphate/ATP-dependent NAD kinase
VARLGFLVNPISGMGGRVGLKGTDGVVDAARASGAEPVSPDRAIRFLSGFRDLASTKPRIDWLTCSGVMGGDELRTAGFVDAEIVYRPGDPTTAQDSKRAALTFVNRGVDLILFCGGDGTARDVAETVESRVPILGIPAGVKMHSSVFAVNPVAGGRVLAAFLRGDLRVGDAEILDLDEAAYRAGHWKVRLFATAKTVVEPNLVQMGKMLFAEVTDEATHIELAEHFKEAFEEEPDTVFFFGPGTTLQGIAVRLGFEKSLLGIDAVLRGKTIARDLEERRILEILDAHPNAKLVVSPIGAQGFVLGRGNLQLSPAVLRRIGLTNLLVVATPSKLAVTPLLRVDSGDETLDAELRAKKYLFVLIGYRTTKLHPIEG